MFGSTFLPWLVEFIARRPPLSRILFDRLFRAGKAPRDHSPFLEEAAGAARPGEALDVATGDGRNAVFLAQLGWDVTAFDISEEALARAGQAAQRKGVNLRAVRSTAESFDYGEGRWDLIALFYAWVPVSDAAFASRLKRSLRPGGLIVFEHFLHDGPASPPKAAGAPDPGELRELFSGFEILRYEEVTSLPEWEGPMERGKLRRLARLAARKPANGAEGAD